MSGSDTNTHRKKPSRSRKIVLLLLLASLCALAAVIGSFSGSEREDPLWFLFSDYTKLHSTQDQKSKKFIELGSFNNATSTGYEVNIFDADKADRDRYDFTRRAIIYIGSSQPHPEHIEFDGNCYFIVAEPSGYVTGIWRDPTTGVELCFYVLTPQGEKYITEK